MADDLDEWNPTIYETDDSPSDILTGDILSNIAVIRNSDRVLFRRCRRRWGWNSHLRGNLGPKTNALPLWIGSGFHFGLEDHHGLKQFPSASDAYRAYARATLKYNKRSLPIDYHEYIDIACGMLDYYTDLWMIGRDPLQTFWWEGQPQVEVNFRIQVPWARGKYGYDEVVYSGTIDRIIIDQQGTLWVVEYKTAKQIFTMHYAMDGQITSYVWAAKHLYPGYDVGGVIYQQHRKNLPKTPELLASGKFSTKKNMLTTQRHYRDALIRTYGDLKWAPIANVDYMNSLIHKEDMDHDIFVRRDKVYRNDHQCMAEGEKILLEIEEMLNPDLPLYPNPSRDCAYMCPFSSACVAIDDGSDWQSELEMNFQPRERTYDGWRSCLEIPNQKKEIEHG